MTIGKRIKLSRQNNKITQSDLAKICDLSQANMTDYERDKCSPPIPTLKKLAQALKINFEWLATGEITRETELAKDYIKLFMSKHVKLNFNDDIENLSVDFSFNLAQALMKLEYDRVIEHKPIHCCNCKKEAYTEKEIEDWENCSGSWYCEECYEKSVSGGIEI